MNTIDWTALATDAIANEGTCGGRTVAELADALERGYEAGTVIYEDDEDYIDFRVLSLPPRAMTLAEVREAVENFEIPAGVTGVLTIENNWTDPIDVVTTRSNGWFADGDDLHYAWVFEA